MNLSFAPQGFFEKKDDGSWESMQPFRTLPRAELDAPGTRMIDLDGDGRADILVSEDHVYTWYASEGRQGFSTGGSVPKAFDENVGPNVSFVDARQSVFLADMTGDGLVDIVRVRNGEVCYWPNLGYGRFGAKVTLDGSPFFAAPDRFDPSRIRFTDLDGSGPSDIVYLGNGKVECWLNRSGNSLSGSPVVIDGIPELSRAATVDFIDLFGQGVPCLVLSSPTARPGVRGLKYIDLRAGMKPWLMDGYATGSGQRTSFGYTSSVQFYLEDLLAGTPWPERLAMPVHCLTSVETVDLVSGHRYAAHYTYHNGHYDHAEKEFRGFGLVVQTDTEDFEHWKGESTNLLSADLHQEPVITRLWTRTGSVTESIEIEDADAMDAAEWREAHRAARGSAARQTVSDASGRLYSETAGEVLVRRLQPRGQNRHAVFLPLPSRSMTWQYENGDLSDPQVSQTVPVRFDDLGNLLESASIAYPRKKRDETLPQDVVRMQEETHITYQVSHFTEDIDTADVHCLRVPYRSESYVLEHVPCRGDVYSRADFADWERYAELAGKSWTRFYSDDLRTPAPDGKIAFPVVNYENFILAYPDGLPEELFGDRVGEGRLRAAHYVRLDGEDGWWVPSGRALLLEDGETVADARNRFYLATVYETLLGARTKVFFSDPDCLLLAAVEDPFGNVSRVREFDYRSLSPVLVEDINGNLSATVTDELGMVMASAVMGKGSEADSLAGFDDRTSAADEPLVKAFFEATAYPELEALAKQLLRSATSRYVYRLDRFEQEGKPLCSALISREQHAAVQPDSDVQISFTYTSGLGQVILSKVQAEVPGDDRAVRWLGNGRTVLNNKGNAVMQYEPYFSDTPAFEDAKEMVEQGVTPLLHYDPLGRLVRTDFPDGTFDAVVSTRSGWRPAPGNGTVPPRRNRRRWRRTRPVLTSIPWEGPSMQSPRTVSTRRPGSTSSAGRRRWSMPGRMSSPGTGTTSSGIPWSRPGWTKGRGGFSRMRRARPRSPGTSGDTPSSSSATSRGVRCTRSSAEGTEHGRWTISSPGSSTARTFCRRKAGRACSKRTSWDGLSGPMTPPAWPGPKRSISPAASCPRPGGWPRITRERWTGGKTGSKRGSRRKLSGPGRPMTPSAVWFPASGRTVRR